MGKRIRVPDGMLESVERTRIAKYGHLSGWSTSFAAEILEAALQWLSENPIVPTDEQIFEIAKALKLPGLPNNRGVEQFKGIVTEWQRGMFRVEDTQTPPPSYSSMNATLAELYCEECGAAMRRDSGFSDKGSIVRVFVHHETPTCIHSGKRFAAPKVALREIGNPDDPIRDLLVNPVIGMVNGEQINDRLRKAFLLGQRSAKK